MIGKFLPECLQLMACTDGIESSLDIFSSPSDSAPDSSGTVIVMPVVVFSIIVASAVVFDEGGSLRLIWKWKTGGRKVSVDKYVSKMD